MSMHRLQRLIQKTTERSISMEHYTSPEMEIIVFEAEDVITASVLELPPQ